MLFVGPPMENGGCNEAPDKASTYMVQPLRAREHVGVLSVCISRTFSGAVTALTASLLNCIDLVNIPTLPFLARCFVMAHANGYPKQFAQWRVHILK